MPHLPQKPSREKKHSIFEQFAYTQIQTIVVQGNIMTNIAPTTLTAIRKQYNKQQLCEMLSLSERTLENMVNAGNFPPPVRIGKYVYWSEHAVLKWQQSLFLEQENWTQKATKGVDLGYLDF